MVSTVQSDRSFESIKKPKTNVISKRNLVGGESEDRTTAYDQNSDKLNADLPISKLNVSSV